MSSIPIPIPIPIPVDDPKFDALHWTHDYLDKNTGVSKLMPDNWKELLLAGVEHPPKKFDDECGDVLIWKADRSKRADAINIQARSYEDALWPVQRVLGSTDLPKPKLATKLLVAILAGALEPVIFYVKGIAMRRRPVYTCTEDLIEPMFGRPTDVPLNELHPGHPSYPSGHATMAYALAFLYQTLYQKSDIKGVNPADFETAAKTVADNRVIAGVHFPADSKAGELLARLVVGWLMDSTNNKNAELFRTIAGLAWAEW